MLLFVFTAVLAAVILGLKFTKDIFPKPLKLWLCKRAAVNWMKHQPRKLGIEKATSANPTSFAEVGVLADQQEMLAERPVHITNSLLRDEYVVYGTDDQGNAITVKIIKLPNNRSHATIVLAIQDDATYHVSYEGDSPNDSEFSVGNLRMETVEAFRIHRLWYNGVMTCFKPTKETEVVHVVFNFLWKPLGSPVDNRKCANEHLLANYFCSKGYFGESFPEVLKILPEGYFQPGALHGNVNLGNTDVSRQFYLYGCRSREIISNTASNQLLDVFPVVNQEDSLVSGKRDDTRRLELFAIGETGNGFRLTAFNDEWTDGRMFWASYEVALVSDIDCSPSEIFTDQTLPKLFQFRDNTRRTVTIEIWPAVKTLQLPSESQITFLKLTINGQDARGILIRKSDVVKSWRHLGCPCAAHLMLNCIKCPRNQTCISSCEKGEMDDKSLQDPFVLEFSHPDCLKVPLVGGKGASLARLETFAKMKPQSNAELRTARGFCTTTTLFKELLDLEKFTDIFASSSVTGSDQGLQDACSAVMKMIKSCDADKISTLISHRIEKIFGDENRNKIRFAVRSSGVLEDGADLSCAGQNETFLGVTQVLIPQKIVECWASLFTVQSVRYRLNHGQPAVSEMGVVIQEMVAARTAGVIFTADPRTGNPFQMIITANYGLGESVVSGSCDPDTITLTRHGKKETRREVTAPTTTAESEKCLKDVHKRFIIGPLELTNKWWEDVTIQGKVLGAKKTKIICTALAEEERDTGGDRNSSTEEIRMADQESRQFCLDEETAIKLGVVAAQIELYMAHQKPVDIEWAIDQRGQIFILQCRNLTALDAWTDFEILHELDGGLRTKLDRFTTANTGEVLPKPIHALTHTVNRSMDFGCQQQVYIRKDASFPLSPYLSNCTPIFQQKLFINMIQTIYSTVEEEITTASVCIDQTIFGRQVIDEDIRKTAAVRFGIASGYSKIKDLLQQIKLFITCKSLVEKENRRYKNFQLDYSGIPQRSLDVFNQLTEDLFDAYHIICTHLTTSGISSGSQIFLFLFLSEGKKPSEWDSSLFEDASRLLSVFANVESAEMPEDMNQLGDQIMEHSGEREHIVHNFLEESSPDKALQWLRGNAKVSRALDNFFKKHGHRGFAEMDLGEPSWESDPASFLPILRSTVRNKLSQSEGNDAKAGISASTTATTTAKAKIVYKNDDELLDSLSSNLKPMTRRLLKIILPTCRNAIVCREKSKSLLVRVLDQFKQKYHYLAQLMLQEQLLPDASLIVHLTHYEIGQLIRNGASSTILQKAMKRQKMYPLMEKMEYPEICVGLPQEIDTSAPVTITDTIQATPVSRGIAKGVAKVCLSVGEASELLQPGDILITRGTDIAWSPFFPILGGVVTELGGLISHGAVVAREYGLPCIVGAINATKIFKTGEFVILDGGKGTLSKTENP